MNCLFCDFISKEKECDVVYEDEHIFAFVDIKPTSEGHTLVLPKKHYVNIFDIPSDVLCDVMPGLKKVAKAIKKATNCEGLNIGVNNGTAAGQAIFHMHFHLIPRYEGDGLKHWPKKDASNLKEVAEKIKSCL